MGLLSRQPPRVQAMKKRLYDLIDRATSEYLSAPNFALNTDVISCINGAPDPAYASGKACKRFKLRLAQKNPRVQQLTLQVLEHCVRSCGERFHAELARSELFPELLRIADRSSWSGAEVQAQVLALLQEWAYTLRPAQFTNAYSQLKARGLPFPPHQGGVPTGGAAAPGFEPYPGLSPGPPQPAQAGGGYGSFPQPYPRPGAGGPTGTPPPGAPGALPPDLLSPSQPPEQQRAGLEVARNTLNLFDDMLDGAAEEEDAKAVRQDYITDMVQQVTAMKARLTALIERVSDEGILSTALELNDSTQRSLDRYADMVAAADGRRPRPPPRPRPVTAEALQPPAAAAAAPAAAAAAVLPAAAAAGAAAAPGKAGKAPVIDLLSLDDWEPSPAPPPAANGASSSAHAEGLHPPPAFSAAAGSDFSLPSPAVEAKPLRQPPSVPELAAGNNPFAAGFGGGAPPASQAAAPPPAATAPPAGSDAANPFLNDAAFAPAAPLSPAAATPPPAFQPAAVAAPALVISSPSRKASAAGSGNPFAALGESLSSGGAGAGTGIGRTTSFPAGAEQQAAADAFAAAAVVNYPGAPAQQQQAGAPPALAVPPALAGAGYPAVGAAAVSPAGGYYPPPVSPGFGSGGPAPAYMRPMSDAFTELSLAAIQPKRDEPPPPPRGVPMRAVTPGSTADSTQQDSSGPAAAAAEQASTATSATPPTPAPASTAPPAASPTPTTASALSAFDAFDTTARTAASPTPAAAPALSAFDAFDQLASARSTSTP